MSMVKWVCADAGANLEYQDDGINQAFEFVGETDGFSSMVRLLPYEIIALRDALNVTIEREGLDK